jgi:hypothetical protein
MQLMLPVFLEESWSLYVVDVEKKHMLVMDPTDASRTHADMENKHGASAAKIRRGLRHTIHECFTGWHVSAMGWTTEYNVGTHPSCTRYAYSADRSRKLQLYSHDFRRRITSSDISELHICREESGLAIVLYIRDFNGLNMHTEMTQVLLPA